MEKEQKTDNNRIWLFISGTFSFLGAVCLPSLLNLKSDSLVISNSWFGAAFWAVCWYLLYRTGKVIRQERAEKRNAFGCGILPAGIIAFLFSLSIAFGVSLERAENVDFTDVMMWLSVSVWTVIFMVGIYGGWKKLEDFQEGTVSKPLRKKTENIICKFDILNKWDRLTEKQRILLTAGFLIICWLPVFLAVYPGFFVYDAQDEFIQVQTRNFTTHHPLPHVLLLGGIILAVHKFTDSYNTGIAVYTLLQMLFMAGVFTYVIHYMKRNGVKRYLRVITTLYFAFFPVIVMFTLCSAKDGIFTAALLLLLLSMKDLAEQKAGFFGNFRRPFLFFASALVMICFRHNGMYAFLVMVPVVMIYMKGCRAKTGIMLGAVFLVYFLLSAGIAGVLSADDAENQEILTVPIQQLARTYKYDKESLTEEQLTVLYEIIPEEVLPYYTAKVSDGVKIWFNNQAYSANPAKYRRLWLDVGMEHPFTYLNAWFMTSYGFWYPDTVIDVYRGNGVFTFTYGDSSFFGYEVELPGVRESKIPWLDEVYRRLSLEIAQQKIPVLSMLFSPGFLFWIFIFTGGYVYYRKRYELLVPFTMLLLVWLTAILGPTYLPRYVLILWFALPGMAAVLVNRK